MQSFTPDNLQSDQHKRLHFTPRGLAAYDFDISPFRGPISRGVLVGKPSDPRGYSWRTRLPFPFAFADKKWTEVCIKLNGSLTFGVPEAKDYPERETWPDGTIRSMASAFDTRSISGEGPEFGRVHSYLHPLDARCICSDLASSALSGYQ